MLAELLFLTQYNNLICEYNLESRLPKRGENIYHSGLELKDQAHFIYGPPSIDDPILMLIEPLCDKNYVCIPSGYYQLTLEPSRKFLYLIQSGKTVAIIPVVKVEIDRKKNEEKLKDQIPKSYWKQKRYLRKKKKEAKKRKRDIENKKIDAEKKIYSKATIELSKNGTYYMVTYEKEMIKAFGILKYR